MNEINGAVFVNFWVKRFSQVRSLKKQTLVKYFSQKFALCLTWEQSKSCLKYGEKLAIKIEINFFGQPE